MPAAAQAKPAAGAHRGRRAVRRAAALTGIAPPAGDEPALTPEERTAFESGVAQFNAGLYFECHDTLEDLWRGLRGPDRDFVQGLIQVSVAFYHLGNDNTEGAASLLGRALARLARYPARHWGMHVDAQRLALQGWLARIGAGEASAGERPRWRFDWLER